MDLDVTTAFIVWISLAAAFAIIELGTVAFVAIYFALGSVAAALVAAFGGNMTWQLIGFVATTVVLMFLTRPVLKRKLEAPDVATNVNLVIGKSGIVTIPIDNDSNTGQIRIGSEYWTARSPHGVHGLVIPIDTRVTVLEVEGVTARVEPIAPSA